MAVIITNKAGTGGVSSVATAGLATGGPITSIGTVTVTAAVKADQTTGTSTAVAVVPGVQQFHASASKAWVSFNGTGTVAILGSYNVTSITDNGVGNYTINFTTSFSSTTYAAVLGCIGNPGIASVVVNERQDTPIRTVSANAIYTANCITSSLADVTVISAAYFGAQ